MRGEVRGMDKLIRRLQRMQRAVHEAKDEVAQEVATEILAKAIDKASGANYIAAHKKHVRAQQRRKTKGKVRQSSPTAQQLIGARTGKKSWAPKSTNYSRGAHARSMAFFKYNMDGSLQYPVPVITGTFRRAHKMRRVGHGRYEVYGDLGTANYFTYVHDGTSKMAGRPTIDDAVFEIRESGEAKNIAVKIVMEKLRGI
jgi:hypothetical protein